MLTYLMVVLATTAVIGPLEVVKSADVEVQKVLKSPEPTVEKLAAKADDYVDFFELAKRALGPEWAKLTKKQREEFSATMKGLLRASYAQRAIADNRGGAAKFEYGDEKVSGDEATVSTTLNSKNDTFPVTYKLFRTGAKWKIYDVVTDDVSLVATYNDQFRQVIGKKGVQGLLNTLKAKKEQLEKAPRATK